MDSNLEHQRRALADVLALVPNNELARHLGVSAQAVSKWPRVPDGRVIQVAEATGWKKTPHELRPDLYPHPFDGLPAHLRTERAAA